MNLLVHIKSIDTIYFKHYSVNKGRGKTMESFSKKISQYFLAYALIKQNQLEWCAYSFEVLLEQVVSFCLLL